MYDLSEPAYWGIDPKPPAPESVKLTKNALLKFLAEYPDEGECEIQIQDEDGNIFAVMELAWSGGPWIVIESTLDKVGHQLDE